MTWNEPGPGHDPWNQGGRGKRGDRSIDLPKILNRIKILLGRSSPGSGKPPNLVYGVIVLLLAAWLASGFYTIDAQERGVKLRFGAVVADVGPGLGWHLPWPMGEVEKVNVTKLRQASVQSTLLTKDQNLVDIGLTVQFRVSSAREYLFDVANPDDTLSQTANSILRGIIGNYNVDDVLGNSQQQIADQVKQKLQEVLDSYGCGLYVVDVSLDQVQPPQKVQDAFADAIKAQSDRQTMIDTAQAYAKDRLPQARSQAAQEISDAQSYRTQVVSKAKGDAARFDALLGAYRKSPKLTREQMYIDTLANVLRDSRVIIDGRGGRNGLTLRIDQAGGAGPDVHHALRTSEKSQVPAPAASAQSGSTSSGSSSGQGDQGGSNARSRSRGGYQQ